MNQTRVTSDFTDCKTATWRLIGALLLFLGLSWLTLDAHAQMSPKAAFATVSMASVHAVTTDDALAPALSEGTQVFTLTVLNTNDTWGYLDPCGWRTPIGGVARRATAIKREREKNNPLLVLDAGNSLSGDRPPANVTQGASTIEYMNMMGYDAMTIGQADLRLGQDVIRSRISESTFPFISANAMVSSTGKLLAPPFVTREVGGRQVAIIGLTGNYEPNPVPEFLIEDPLSAIKQLMPKVTAVADIIIVLSSAGNPTDLAIAQNVPGIDLIIEGGQFQSFGRSQLEPTTNTLLIHADYPAPGHAGRNLGKTTLVFDENGNLINNAWELIPMGPEIPDDPVMAQWRAAK